MTTMNIAASQEALNIAYKTGIRELAPLVDRIKSLETQVTTLTERLEALEKKSAPPHMKGMEVR